MGRPTDFTEDLAREICARMREGRSLRAICRDDEDMPSQRTVYYWLESNEAFLQKYVCAREGQADSIFDEAQDIADSATPEDVQVARLRVDTIKWRAGKLAPKKYGDAQHVKHSGPDGGAIPIVSASVDLSGLSTDELRRLRDIASKIGGGTDEPAAD